MDRNDYELFNCMLIVDKCELCDLYVNGGCAVDDNDDFECWYENVTGDIVEGFFVRKDSL